MTASAYILLSTEPSKTPSVVQRLRAIKGAFVREVAGPYDIIVELECDTVVDITSVVRSKIRMIPGITSSVTCMWMEGAGRHAGGE